MRCWFLIVYFTKVVHICDSANCKRKNLYTNNCFKIKLFASSAINIENCHRFKAFLIDRLKVKR